MMKYIRQIRDISQTEKVANFEEGLTGSNEVLKSGIRSSQSRIDKYSDERYQRDNDAQIEKNILK